MVRIFGQCPYTNGHSRQKQTFITETILTWWVVELGYLLLHDIWHYMCVCVGPRQPANQKLETWNSSIFCYWPVPLSPPPQSDLQVYLCFQPEAVRFKWHSHQISHSSKTLSPFWSNVSRCVSPYSLLANQILTSNSTGIFIYSKGTKHLKLGKIKAKTILTHTLFRYKY